MQCEYCSKVYNRESNLKYHQKNDKECLQRQAKPIPKHTCMYCEKNYTAKTLQRHMIKCNSKNEYYIKQELLSLTNELRQKDEEITKMRDVLISQMTQIVNIPQIIHDINDESMKMKIVERFRDEFLIEQEKGLLEFSYMNLYKNIFNLSLEEVEKIFTRSEEREMEMKLNDDNMSSLTKHLSIDIINKSISLYNDSVRLMEEMRKPKILNKEELTSQNVEPGYIIKNQEVDDDEEEEEIVYVIEEEEEDLSK